MKYILVFLLAPLILSCQTSDIEYIRTHCCSKLGSLDYNIYGTREPTLVEYINRNLLTDEIDEKFISNRSSLTKMNVIFCDDSLFIVQDELKSKQIKVTVSKKQEKIIDLDVEYFAYEGEQFLDKIEGMKPKGFNIKGEDIERIETVEITVGNNKFLIPSTAYNDFLSPNFCYTNGPMKPMEVYISDEGKYFYLYIFGDSGARTYENTNVLPASFMAKLIFDHEKYIGRIVLDYKVLKLYHTTCKGFIGF